MSCGIISVRKGSFRLFTLKVEELEGGECEPKSKARQPSAEQMRETKRRRSGEPAD